MELLTCYDILRLNNTPLFIIVGLRGNHFNNWRLPMKDTLAKLNFAQQIIDYRCLPWRPKTNGGRNAQQNYGKILDTGVIQAPWLRKADYCRWPCLLLIRVCGNIYNNKTIWNVAKSVVQLTSPMTNFKPVVILSSIKTRSQENVGRSPRPFTWPHQSYQRHDSDGKGKIILEAKK
jgi:hypothetical protein